MDLNHRPAVYKTAALPLSYSGETLATRAVDVAITFFFSEALDSLAAVDSVDFHAAVFISGFLRFRHHVFLMAAANAVDGFEILTVVALERTLLAALLEPGAGLAFDRRRVNLNHQCFHFLEFRANCPIF